MELENLIMTELKSIDLSGVKVVNLSCGAEITYISFEIGDVRIDFAAESESVFQVTALTHAGQTYTDKETLSKGYDWSKYIWTVAYPIVEKHRPEPEEMPEEDDVHAFNASVVEEPEGEEIGAYRLESEKMGVYKLQDEEAGTYKLEDEEIDVYKLEVDDNDEAKVEKPEVEEIDVDDKLEGEEDKPLAEGDNNEIKAKEVDIDKTEVNKTDIDKAETDDDKPKADNDEVKVEEPEEAVVVSLGENTLNKRIKEAEDRGHKEGYKAARKKNAQELGKLKKKYHLIIFFTIFILLAAFVAFLHVFGFDFSILIQF